MLKAVALPDLTGQNSPRTAYVVRASLIIVVYNGWSDLSRCLDSLVASSLQETEVIVVDNASPEPRPSDLTEAYPQVIWLRSPRNTGFGAGSNLGAQHARSEYLAFLNPDTSVEPGWLEALIAALEADPQVGMATSKILLMDDLSRINTCGNDVHISGLTLCRGIGTPAHAYSQAEEVAAVSGAAFVIHRRLFEQLGGFDAAYFMYMEDTDLSWRARLAGRRILYAPDSIVHHRYRLNFGPSKTYYQERNRYRMLIKCLQWRSLLALLPALLLAELVTWGFVLLSERRNLSNKLRAYFWTIRNLPELLIVRCQTQKQRKISDRELLATAQHRLVFEQTGEGRLARSAHLFFDPVFLLLKRIGLLLASSRT